MLDRQLQTILHSVCLNSRLPTFDIVTTPNATQRHALDLIKQIRP
jgi:hypothetical protein